MPCPRVASLSTVQAQLWVTKHVLLNKQSVFAEGPDLRADQSHSADRFDMRHTLAKVHKQSRCLRSDVEC